MDRGSKGQISRRQFLRATAAGLGAVAAGGLLTTGGLAPVPAAKAMAPARSSGQAQRCLARPGAEVPQQPE